MGQVYDVNLLVKFKDKEGAKKALQDKIARAEQENINYGLPVHCGRHFDTEDLWDLMALFFGGWEGKFHAPDDWEKNHEMKKEGVWIWAGFDASYGWESVMMDAFTIIAPFLQNGSEIKIYPDSGCDHGKVYAGKVKWLS